jgi:hypothetical protein
MKADLKNGDPENYTTPDYSETGDAQFLNQALTKDVRQEYGADLGGFIMKDKIWFFGAYDRVKINQTLTTLDITNPTTFEHGFPISYFQNKYSGKLTFNLFQGTSIVGSVFSDEQTQEGTIAAFPTTTSQIATQGRRDTGGPDYSARVNQLFGSFGIFTFQYAQHKDRFNTKPAGLDLPQLLDYTFSPTGATNRASGGFGQVFGPTINNSSKREAFNASFTGYVGNHELKIGGDYQKDNTFGSTYFTGTQRLRVRPCNVNASSQCIADAPFYTNSAGNTFQVFYQHDLFVDGTPSSFTVLDQAPFETPTKRYSAFFQDQWRIIPTLTVNAGLRWDTENVMNSNLETAFKLENEWAPRVGVVWDFTGDGTSKLYASAGRFYYALPTDLNVRVFSANTALQTFNYSPTDLNQDPTAPRASNFQGGSPTGEPVDGWTNGEKNGSPITKAAYQDELTLGVEKALDPTLSVGLKGTYRTLGRTVEDRCDLDYTDPLAGGSTCALFNPGGDGLAASGGILTCNGSAAPPEIDPNAGQCGLPGVPVGDAKRIFRGIEFTARKQFSNTLWAQASYLYSSLRGNYSGAIREASGQTDPGINADYDYYQFAFKAYGDLELDRPHQGRLDVVYNAPFGVSAGLQFYVRSGLPISRLGFFNNFYPDLLYLDQRGSTGRTPTDYDVNLSLGYNLNIGPVTITPQAYLYNALNRQTVNSVDATFNPAGSFVTNPASPFFGQAGEEPGTAANCPASASGPCPDNPDYFKANGRNNGRLLRIALKVTF